MTEHTDFHRPEFGVFVDSEADQFEFFGLHPLEFRLLGNPSVREEGALRHSMALENRAVGLKVCQIIFSQNLDFYDFYREKILA